MGNSLKFKRKPSKAEESQQANDEDEVESTEAPKEPEVPEIDFTFKIELLPHAHTLFCERKKKVCTAVGRVQELEKLQICSVSTVTTWVWSRSKDRKIWENIPGSENSLQYTMTRDDVACYLSIQCNGSEDIMAKPVGPVFAGPARLLDLRIRIDGTLGNGAKAIAEYEYIGGYEGPSQFWWIRINKGASAVLIQTSMYY